MKDLTNNNGITKKSTKHPRLWLFALLLIILFIILIAAFSSFVDWNQKYFFQKQKPVELKVQWPLAVKQREEPKIVEKTITPATLEEVNTPIKKYACDKWLKETGTDAYCLTMIAIFQAESGWNNEAWGYNDGPPKSLDYGVAQINSQWWDYPGCAMIEIVIEAKNIDCAYMIWDRADGEEGNGKGKFTPWMAYVNDRHLAHLENDK